MRSRSRWRSGRAQRPILALGLLICIAAGCAGPLARPASDVIAVTGRGHVAVKPDTAMARLGAEARRPTLDAAIADVAQRMTAILERVKAAGVRAEDITTVHYTAVPLAPPTPGVEETPRIAGYHVLNLVDVKVHDVAAVGRIVDAAVSAGANAIHGITFTVEDRKAAEARARELAVAEARSTAAALARASGVTLGRLVSLTESAFPEPVYRAGLVSLAARAAGPVEPGEQQITVTVEARFRIGSPTAR
jgi:uncharacterized protein